MKHRIFHIALKTLLWLVAVAVGLPLLVAVLLYIPPVQRLAVNIACTQVSKSTGMQIEVGRFLLKFPLDLDVGHVTVVEATGDTMVVAGNARLKVSPLPLLKGEIALRGLRADSVAYNLGNADSILWLRVRVRLAEIDRGELNLGRGLIDAGHARVEGARVSLVLRDTVTPEKSDTAATKPLLIRADEIILKDIDYSMALPPVIDTLQAHVADGRMLKGVVDIGGRHITASSLRVDGVRARYLTLLGADTPVRDVPEPAAATPLDSMWLIEADTVGLKAPYALYAQSGARPLPGFDPSYIEAYDTEIEVVKFTNRGPTLSVPVHRLRTTERCGLSISATGTFEMDTTAMRARSFRFLTNHSRIDLDAMMGIGDLAADPALPLRARLRGSLAGADAALVLPALKPVVAALPSPASLEVNLDAEGTPRRLVVEAARVAMPGVMWVSAEGEVLHLTDPGRLGGKMKISGAITDAAAVRHSLTRLKVDTTIHIAPLKIDGSIDYLPGRASGNLGVTSQGGKMLAKGSWNARSEGYDASLRLDDFPIGAFVPSTGVGRVTATLKADGHGYNPLKRGTELTADVDIVRLALRERELTDATLTARLTQGRATARLTSDNPDADLDLLLTATMDSGVVRGTLHGDIRDLDLMALGLSPTPMGGTLGIDASGTYDPRTRDITAQADISDLHWQADTLTLSTPDLSVRASLLQALTTVDVSNGDLMARAVVRAPLDTLLALPARLEQVIKRRIEERTIDIAELQRTVPQLDAELSMGPDNLVAHILSADGIGAGSLTANMRNDSLLHLNAFASGVQIGGNLIDSVDLQANQHGKFLVYNGKMVNGPGSKMAEWADVGVRGYLADDKAAAFVDQRNQQGQQGYRLGAVLSMNDSLLRVRFAPYDPTIAYKKWTLNEGNYLSYNIYNKRIDADLKLVSADKGSSLWLYTRPLTPPDPDYSPKELVAEVRNIQISDWIAFSPFAPPMSGSVSADAVLHRYKGNLAGHVTASVDNLVYDRRKVGDFGLELDVTNNPATRSMWADGSLSVNGVKTVTVSGALNDSTAGQPFLLDFSMIRFPLSVANPFIPAGTATLDGTLNGTMKIGGSGSKPVFDGYLQFDSASVKVDMIGSRYTFSDVKIPVTDNIVSFKDFAINTLNDNPLRIDGTADLTDLSNVGVDLSLNGTNMLMVNSSRAHGADIYGKGYLDIAATAKGDMRWLAVDADVQLDAGSNVTYVLSSAQSALTSYSTADMVKFVNFADSLQVSRVDSVAPTMNLLLNAELNIQNNTTLCVDISTDGKNRAQIEGYGTLDFSMNPQNNGRLTGRYNIEGGFVRYTPPLMGEKNFKLQEGSYVSFNGDMLNPLLNLHAVDRVKANVTPEGGGNSYLAYFNIGVSVTGSLQNMNVAFNLSTDDDITIQNELQSMSADQRANQAMNMLLYNTYTGPGTKGTSNLSANPLYSFLASQLNSFTANYVKGVDLTFGIDQYDKTLNGAQSTATTYSYQLSKSLWDNRIRIVVGGNYTTDANTDENFAQNLVNDISFEYLLNRTGSMYVRIFRHTGYESILEGEVTATGVGFVYKRNLNSLRDMFRFRKPKAVNLPEPVLPGAPPETPKEESK